MTQTVVRPGRAGAAPGGGARRPGSAGTGSARPAPRRGRWARRLLVALAVAIVLAGAAAALVYAPATSVRQVDVVLADPADVDLAASVRERAGVAVGDPWLLVDLADVRQRVAELAAVSSVQVERSWPDTVTIRVAPRRTVAMIRLGDVVAEIGPGGRVGRVLEPGESPTALVGTVTVAPGLLAAGPPPPGAALDDPVRRAVLVVEQLPVDLRPSLVDGRLSAEGSLDFVLRDGGLVRLGELDDLPAKVHAIRSVLTGAVDLQCLDTLDVRRPDRPTITRTENCSIDPPTVDTTVVGRAAGSGTGAAGSGTGAAGSGTGTAEG